MKKIEINKRKGFIIVSILIIIAIVFSGIYSNTFTNLIKRNSIRIVVNPLTLYGLYYYEINPNGKMAVCYTKINEINPKISSADFKIKNVEKKKKKIILNEVDCK